MDKLIVRFIKGDGCFVAGDTTQFEKEKALDYAKKGIVEILTNEVISTQVIPADLSSTLPTEAELEINPLICAICGKEYKSEKTLKAHKTKAHAIKE